MRGITVVYHWEDGQWWADSPDPELETFVAGGRTLDETRRLAAEGAAFHLAEQVALTEVYEDGVLVVPDDPNPQVRLRGDELISPSTGTTTRPVAVSLRSPPAPP